MPRWAATPADRSADHPRPAGSSDSNRPGGASAVTACSTWPSPSTTSDQCAARPGTVQPHLKSLPATTPTIQPRCQNPHQPCSTASTAVSLGCGSATTGATPRKRSSHRSRRQSLHRSRRWRRWAPRLSTSNCPISEHTCPTGRRSARSRRSTPTSTTTRAAPATTATGSAPGWSWVHRSAPPNTRPPAFGERNCEAYSRDASPTSTCSPVPRKARCRIR